ncbi:MAG: hypothetical protein JNG88_10560 [Phycisphaerales bacterium]|nr:hypothetical protein [Phycisphaerales bacterium]
MRFRLPNVIVLVGVAAFGGTGTLGQSEAPPFIWEVTTQVHMAYYNCMPPEFPPVDHDIRGPYFEFTPSSLQSELSFDCATEHVRCFGRAQWRTGSITLRSDIETQDTSPPYCCLTATDYSAYATVVVWARAPQGSEVRYSYSGESVGLDGNDGGVFSFECGDLYNFPLDTAGEVLLVTYGGREFPEFPGVVYTQVFSTPPPGWCFTTSVRHLNLWHVSDHGWREKRLNFDLLEGQPPVAQVNGPISGIVGQHLTYSDRTPDANCAPSGERGSYDRDDGTECTPGAGIIDWAWSVDGQFVSGGPSLSHAFSAPGVHEITLEITDNEGQEGFFTRNIPIYPCRGDVNGDGIVDMRDFAALQPNYGSSNATREEGDLDGDEDVDLDDALQLMANLGEPCF